MSRQVVRQMKRSLAVAAGNRPGAGPDAAVRAQESALSLLSRSIAFGHRRLAIRRLLMAVEAGTEVLPEHWIYCREAATDAEDASLKTMFLQAAHLASCAVTTATDKRH